MRSTILDGSHGRFPMLSGRISRNIEFRRNNMEKYKTNTEKIQKQNGKHMEMYTENIRKTYGIITEKYGRNTEEIQKK